MQEKACPELTNVELKSGHDPASGSGYVVQLDIFFIKQTALQDKKLLLIVDKMNDAKVKKAIDSLKEMKFTEIEILAFCQ